MECTITDDIKRKWHNVTLLVKNDAGHDNLCHLVPESHLHHMNNVIPVIPQVLIKKYRVGLLVYSPYEYGDLFKAVGFRKVGQKLKK